MAKVTTKEMIALLDEDIKFAKMIGDKEFVGYLKKAKVKLLDAEYPTGMAHYGHKEIDGLNLDIDYYKEIEG